MSRIRMAQTASSTVPVPPALKATIFLDTDGVFKAKMPDGSLVVLSVTNEYFHDLVAETVQGSSSIDVSYNDTDGLITFSVLESGLDSTLIPITPSGNLVATDLQAALEELQLEIDNAGAAAAEIAQDAVAAALVAGTQDGISVAYNDTLNSFSFSNTNKGTVAVAAHEAASDPHPQYQTATESQAQVDAHANRTDNPHATTKAQVGLGNVDNTSDANKPVSTAQQAALDLKYNASNPNGYETPAQLNARDTNNRARANHTGTQTSSTISDFVEASQDAAGAAFSAGTQDGVSVAYNDPANSISITNTDKGSAAVATHVAAGDPHPQYETSAEAQAKVDAHANRTDNPHATTKAQVGLANVDNTSDANKPVSTLQAAADSAVQSFSIQRANHTGTQASSTISDFQEAAQDSAAVMLTSATHDGVSVSYNDVGNSLAITNTDKGSSSVASHVAASDPHPQYLSAASAAAAYQPLDNDLTAVAGLTTTGLVVRTATGTATTRTVVAGAGITVSNGDGISGNPTVAITNVGAAGTFGSATQVPVITTNSQGQISSTVATSISIPSTQVNDFTEATQDAAAAMLTSATHDGVSVSYNDAGNNLAITNTNKGSVAVAAHEAAGDPHPQYTTTAEASAAAPVQSVSGKTGIVTLVKADVGLSNVDNTSDVNKPVSTLQAAADALKSNLAGGNAFTGNQTIVGTVAVGTVSPSASAALQVDSTTQGWLMPRVTTAQMNAIASPAAGLQVFNTDLAAVCTFINSAWMFRLDEVVTTAQASTSVTPTNVTELVTPTLPIGRYAFEFVGVGQTAATTTGIGVRISSTATMGEINASWYFFQAANGTASTFQYNQLLITTDVTSASALTANTNFPISGFGVFNITTTGVVSVQLRTEVAGSSASIRPNSKLAIWRLA